MIDCINKIICGDCLEVMKDWPDNCVDLVLTDPPYGIGIHKMNFVQSGPKRIGKAVRNDYRDTGNWDSKGLQKDQFLEIQRLSKKQVIWGGNHITHLVPNSRKWYVWDKRIEDKYKNDFADCELAWTNIDGPTRILRYMWSGFLRGNNKVYEPRYHATQKPIQLIVWIIEQDSKPDQLILDPFNGSGTTCVAAKMLSRRFIGIDISEKYCEIARMRLKAVDTGVSVKEQLAGQQSLFQAPQAVLDKKGNDGH